MSKPKQILELEKQLGLTLQELKEGSVLDLTNKNHYQCNDKGEVTGLNLYSNKLKDISALAGLTGLQRLNLASNQLTDISALAGLTGLQRLNLAGNQLTDISALAGLTGLQTLELRDNQLTDISALADLTGLETLNLAFNQLTDISTLAGLTGLVSLLLMNNEIEDIYALTNLKYLQNLYLYNNKLTDISVLENIIKLENLHTLRVNNNPFVEKEGLKLEAGKNHLTTIKNALLRIEEAKAEDAVEGYLPIKVIMLGNHGSGKSSLVHYLQNENFIYTHDTTHILKIETYQKQNNGLPKAYFYDFGGQDFYHGIYQAFLSQQAFTLLLWQTDTNKNEKKGDNEKFPIRNFNVPYWLCQWERSIGGDLFLIRTYKKLGENILSYANENVNEEFFLDLEKEDDTKITNPVKKSAADYFKNVFDVFIKANQEKQDENKIEKGKGKISKKYFDFLINIIEKGKKLEEKPMKLSELKPLYKDVDETRFNTEIEQMVLSGMLLKYNDVVWLNPQAVLTDVHKALSKNQVGKGILDENEVNKILPEANLLNMLMENKVIFKHDYGLKDGKKVTEYIIPNFLPMVKDSGIDYDLMVFGLNNPLFILKYKDFLPFGLINQMICYFGQLPDNKKFWRDQLVFTISQTEKDTKTNSEKAAETKNQEIKNKNTTENESDKIIYQCKILIKINFDELKIEVFAHFHQEKSNAEFKAAVKDYLFFVLQSFYHFDKLNYSINDIYKSFDDFIAKERKFDFTVKENDVNVSLKEDIIIEKNGAKYIDDKASNKEDNENKRAKIQKENRIDFNWKNDSTYISLDNTTFVNYIELLQNGRNPVIKTYDNDLKPYRDLPAYPYERFTPNKIKKMKKIFISYSRKFMKYKDELVSHLSMLHRYGIAKAWSCDEIKAGQWHDQIQKELAEADIIIFMVSHSFIDSDYIMEEEVKKGIEYVKNDTSKKIICVLTGACQWKNWSAIENIYNENMQEKIPSANLSQFQFLPYHQYKNNEGISINEEIVALEQWGSHPYTGINVAYKQIVNKIFDELRS